MSGANDQKLINYCRKEAHAENIIAAGTLNRLYELAGLDIELVGGFYYVDKDLLEPICRVAEEKITGE